MTFEEDSVTLYRLGDFGAWLIAADIDLPKCWYTHGWIRSNLTAFMEWRETISNAAEAKQWWTDLLVLTASEMWSDAKKHYGRHVDPATDRRVAVASFDDTVAAIMREDSVVSA